MDNQEPPHQYATPQEIDLVDLAAVLYRRKVILFLVIAICLIGAVLYWSWGKEKSTISMAFETGRNGTGLVMAPDQTSLLLSSLYLPPYLEPGVKVEMLNLGAGIVGFNQEVVAGQPLEDFRDAANLAFKDLLTTHNKISQSYLQSKKNMLAIKQQELKATKILAVSPGHTAVDLATQYAIEASIMTPQNDINVSVPSRVSDIVTVTASKKRTLYYVVTGIALGIFCGCGFVFFLELISKAKARVQETL